MSGRMIDSHLHFWAPSTRLYPTLVSDDSGLNADFGPNELGSSLELSGVSQVVLVQADDSYDENRFLLRIAETDDRVGAVVGWLPLDCPVEVNEHLGTLGSLVAGVRTLAHTYIDPRWLGRPAVARSLRLLARNSLSLDCVATNPKLWKCILDVAARHPDLQIILAHMGLPSVADREQRALWFTFMTNIARHENVAIKLSGLSSLPGELRQGHVDHVLAGFGPKRLMLGSDWPVSGLVANYETVWRGQLDYLSTLSSAEYALVTSQTASSVYRISGLRRWA